MKKKFADFTAIVTILLILAGAFDFFIESKYSDYSRRLDQFNTEIGNKMVYRCVPFNQQSVFNMSKEGLNGACGIVGAQYSSEKKCYEFYTYGEEISGQYIAESVVNLKKSLSYSYLPLLKLLKWIFYGLALLFSILAIVKGFKSTKLRQSL